MAFNLKRANDRKEWLRDLDTENTYIDTSSNKITYTDFINKELILFSNYSNIRSIPSVIDGLKPGQRKILFTMLEKNI